MMVLPEIALKLEFKLLEKKIIVISSFNLVLIVPFC